jgi:hypothetical protein
MSSALFDIPQREGVFLTSVGQDTELDATLVIRRGHHRVS